jgi:hypothetical protein
VLNIFKKKKIIKKEVIYWTTKDGRKIDIDEMDINHLRNILKMIMRNRKKHKEAVEDIFFEFMPSEFDLF